PLIFRYTQPHTVYLAHIMNDKNSKEKEDPLLDKLLETRSIIISTSVDSKLAEKIIKQILILEQMDPKAEIKVFINSPGGEIYSGFAIFDCLKFVQCPITTIVAGLAASMGSILSLVGDKGRKFAFPNARIMIHQPLLGGVQGQATDLEIHSKQIIKTRAKLADMYADITGKPSKQILKDMERDNWLDADEAMNYGLIDRIITTRSELE
ncbi:MAG: ATP-dependent Clp protease proteolytic subunit, partial [Deltaproteobacteria bacterium]|nr:ATP-dependent Clp protease proteolytic subunit [Deltaproteobacteria bacterium]